MPDVKSSVVFWPGLHPRLEEDIERLDRLFIRHTGRPFYITSARDGTHIERSKHYSGEAIDGRSKDLDHRTKHLLLVEMRALLGNDYDVLLEYEGEPREHYHLEFDPPNAPTLAGSDFFPQFRVADR